MIAAVLCLGVTSPSAVGAPSELKLCRKSCKQGLKACKSEVRSGRAPCSGDRTERRACKQRQQAVAKAGKRTCRAYAKRCRACCKGAGSECATPPEVPRLVGTFPTLDRSKLSDSPLPRAADGSIVILQLPDGDLQFDPTRPRTPVSAAAECAASVLACLAPPERNLAGCLVGVPTCPSDTPWQDDGPMCCPAACAERYQELLATGSLGPVAFTRAIWEAPACIPSLEGLSTLLDEP